MDAGCPVWLARASRRAGLVVALASTQVFLLGIQPTSAANSRSTLAPCPVAAQYGHFPHPNCILRPFALSGAAAVTGTVKVTGLTKKQKGWWVVVNYVMTYKDAFPNVCPVGTVPYDAIPCHQPGVSVAVIGASTPGSPSLGQVPGTDLDSAVPCPTSSTTCTRHYQIPAYAASGRLTLVFQVTQGSVTKNPGNNLGVAGFEVAIPVTIPKYVGAPPKCIALGTC